MMDSAASDLTRAAEMSAAPWAFASADLSAMIDAQAVEIARLRAMIVALRMTGELA